MDAVLLDTHAWAWSLAGDHRLSARAVAVITRADHVFLSPISFFEMAQKVRLGKWPELTEFVDRLSTLLEQQGGQIADLTPAICVDAALMKWEHRDPFDRLLAATALHYRLPVVSADTVFDGLIARLW